MSKEKKQKIYVTKYWQTEGIYTILAEVDMETQCGGRMATIRDKDDFRVCSLHGNEFFFTAEEAIAHVADKQRRAIVLAKQKVKKLEDMNITKITEKK